MRWSDAPIGFIPGTAKEISAKKLAKIEAKICSDSGNRTQRSDNDKALTLIQEKITNAKFRAERDDGNITYERRRSVVDGYKELARGLHPSHFLTFMPGRKVEPETIARNIKKCFNRIERKALGRNWNKFTDERIRFVGFLEKPDITPHYQGVAYVPPLIWETLKDHGSEIWLKLMPAGKFEAPWITNEHKVISYVTKDLHHYWSPGNVVIYKPIPKKV